MARTAALESQPIGVSELPVRSRRFRLTAHPNLLRLLSISVTLGVWEWYGRRVDPIFVSYPTAILRALPTLVATGELPRAFASSLEALGIGFGSAIVLGIVLGLLIGRYRTIDYLSDVQISALYSTPSVALIPILILWFGLGLTSKIVIVFLSAFFPILVNIHSGVRNVSRSLVEIAQAEGASEPQIFTKIIVPASLPFMMTGIRLAVGRAVVGMIVAEMFTAITGLGGMIVNYSNSFQTDKVFVTIIVIVLLGVGLTGAVRYLERRTAPWKDTERAS
jgi:ABC-type nitrate/sulfonate/bicarbonate transport system permease component